MSTKNISVLTSQIKDNLIQKALERKSQRAEQERACDADFKVRKIPEEYYKFRHHPGFQQLLMLTESAKNLGVKSPYFKLHQGVAHCTTRIGEKEYINFSSYNYLGLNGHPYVKEASKTAIDRYGTSVSASRLVFGRSPHSPGT